MTRRKCPLQSCKLRKGDQVIVTAGKAKGSTGKIDQVLRKDEAVIIAGVNLSKRHTKPSQTSQGGIIDKSMPLHISNVSLLDPQKNVPTRIGIRIEDGKKIRYAKKSGAIL